MNAGKHSHRRPTPTRNSVLCILCISIVSRTLENGLLTETRRLFIKYTLRICISTLPIILIIMVRNVEEQIHRIILFIHILASKD